MNGFVAIKVFFFFCRRKISLYESGVLLAAEKSPCRQSTVEENQHQDYQDYGKFLSLGLFEYWHYCFHVSVKTCSAQTCWMSIERELVSAALHQSSSGLSMVFPL